MLCYCGSKREYEECCKSFVMGEKQAETPEQLMRSRFTAYCIQDADYLVDTQHESTRHPSLKHSIEASFSSTEWLSLSVVHSEQVGDNGIVEFIAFFKMPCLKLMPQNSCTRNPVLYLKIIVGFMSVGNSCRILNSEEMILVGVVVVKS